MTIEQKRKLLLRISNLEADISTLKDVRMKLATAEFVSASMSSGGGSRSYTRNQIPQITQAIRDMQKELMQLRGLASGDNSGIGRTIYQVWM